jgi:hypothetical protein
VDAEVYHYGWVRPPHLMQVKRRALDTVHWGRRRAEEYYKKAPQVFDYGPLDRLAVFEGTHPGVMKDRIAAMDWQDELREGGRPNPCREPHKHERIKYRLLTFVENRLLGGRRIGTFRNYTLLDGR